MSQDKWEIVVVPKHHSSAGERNPVRRSERSIDAPNAGIGGTKERVHLFKQNNQPRPLSAVGCFLNVRGV